VQPYIQRGVVSQSVADTGMGGWYWQSFRLRAVALCIFWKARGLSLNFTKRVHWVWAYQGILLGLKKQKLSSSKQLCKFASCVGRGCNWGWRSVFGKVGKSLRATHEFSFALNTAFILGHHNSFLVSYHGKFPSGFAFLVIVAEVHIDVVISVFIYIWYHFLVSV